MRRGSIAGPLILILIGSLFLLNNLKPELSVLGLIAGYWPYLLIGWGAIRLTEVVASAAKNQPLPVNAITGGEWVLAVMLCLIGSGVFAFHRGNYWWSRNMIRMRGVEVFGEAFDYPLSATSTAAGTRRLLIENLQGNVHVVGGDGGEVRVTGRKTVRAFQKSDADAAQQQSPLEIERKGDLMIVRTNQHRITNGDQRASADLEITVPKAVSIECRGRAGDYDVSNVTGSVELDTDRGDVRVQNITGAVRVETRRSDVIRALDLQNTLDLKGRGEDVELENIAGQVTITGAYGGELQFRKLAQPLQFKGPTTEMRVEKVPGQLRLTRAYLNGTNLVGPIVVNSRAKDVQLADFTQAAELQVDKGDIELAPGRVPVPKISAHTRAGEMHLAIPEGAKFELQARCNRGDVENEFGDVLSFEQIGKGGVLRGAVGQGPLLSVGTDRGTLTVRKGSQLTTPEPVPPPRMPKPMHRPPPFPPVPPRVEQ